jgi:hypothetical protein
VGVGGESKKETKKMKQGGGEGGCEGEMCLFESYSLCLFFFFLIDCHLHIDLSFLSLIVFFFIDGDGEVF